MARLQRFCPAGMAAHIIQRGNNREVCFAAEDDFITYAHYLKTYAEQFGVAVHARVFMTNHVHLLLTPESNEGVSSMMQSIGRRHSWGVRSLTYDFN
ncbi:MAG: transposase [Pseudomonadales bacterium]